LNLKYFVVKKIYCALTLCLFFLLAISPNLQAQCPGELIPVQIIINPDSYPQEISWNITTATGAQLANGTSSGTSLCVPPLTCLTFKINDSAGDGICCQYGQGSYYVVLNGDTIATGGNYTNTESVQFNCPPGADCFSAISIDQGSHTAPTRNTWYTYTPDSSGMYFISTCGNNACDTKLWVYDHCQNLLVTNSNEGTIYYDDNSGGCGLQARVNALMEAGETYIIRVGDVNESCSGAINWSLTYNGPVVGCMDETACNFNPVATVDGVCYYEGDPLCPDGRPDLVVLENTIKTSIYLSTINAANCQVVEGCLTGYGMRDIIRFTTHIKNIGDADYYIGSPSAQPTQFSWGNCHGHWHYEGYAEYVMYDAQGQAIPVGFKNGFCVLDLECGDGGTAQFGCSNMGISKQCGDIYGSGLDCQWMDITDIDTGRYTMVVRVNWDNSPDALGRIELSHVNNWAQVCIRLGRDANGNRTIQVINDCPPYTDCAGNVFGSAQLDCEGNCGGTRQMGDINDNGYQDMNDAHKYVEDILGNDINAAACNDINQDGRISVYDAALLSSCVNFGQYHQHTGNAPHNHCNFPGGSLNPEDTVALSITNVDFSEKYVDIGILNPNTRVNALEFSISGIEIWDVENLADPVEYPVQPEFLLGDNKVIAISYQDSMIRKYYEPTPILRVHYYELTDDMICIEQIDDIVSAFGTQTVKQIGGECWEFDVTGLKNFDKHNLLSVAPNPTNDRFEISVNLKQPQSASVSISNSLGQQVFVTALDGNSKQTLNISTDIWPSGIYLVQLHSDSGIITKKLMVNH
jgi:hypothetical protein